MMRAAEIDVIIFNIKLNIEDDKVVVPGLIPKVFEVVVLVC